MHQDRHLRWVICGRYLSPDVQRPLRRELSAPDWLRLAAGHFLVTPWALCGHMADAARRRTGALVTAPALHAVMFTGGLPAQAALAAAGGADPCGRRALAAAVRGSTPSPVVVLGRAPRSEDDGPALVARLLGGVGHPVDLAALRIEQGDDPTVVSQGDAVGGGHHQDGAGGERAGGDRAGAFLAVRDLPVGEFDGGG